MARICALRPIPNQDHLGSRELCRGSRGVVALIRDCSLMGIGGTLHELGEQPDQTPLTLCATTAHSGPSESNRAARRAAMQRYMLKRCAALDESPTSWELRLSFLLMVAGLRLQQCRNPPLVTPLLAQRCQRQSVLGLQLLVSRRHLHTSPVGRCCTPELRPPHLTNALDYFDAEILLIKRARKTMRFLPLVGAHESTQASLWCTG
ncbi:hypothetical protein SAMN05216359_101404 [Roseateles sp. YR242]|nr:hypothetical protein SAMN05216359_101404 [Roseateles sp. YR242]